MAKKPSTEIKVQFQENTAAARIISGAVELPAALADTIDLTGWLRSLVTGCEYEEPDPEAMAKQMMMLTLSAETADQILSEDDMPGLQDIVDNFPGATTGPIEINSLYVAPSNLEDKTGTYVILGWVNEETRVFERASTSAAAIQTGIIGMLGLGIWPIRCQIVRIASKDKGGRHLLKMFPAEG